MELLHKKTPISWNKRSQQFISFKLCTELEKDNSYFPKKGLLVFLLREGDSEMEEHQGNQGFKMFQGSTWEHGGFNRFTPQTVITLTVSAHCTLQGKRVNKETALSQNEVN